MPIRNVSVYLHDLERTDALITPSNSNRPQLAHPHFQGPPDAATQHTTIYNEATSSRMYLFVESGCVNGLLAPHALPNDVVTFAYGRRPSNMAYYKTTKDRFGAGIWSVLPKITARENGFPTTITPLADAKTAADIAAAVSDTDHYGNLGFVAYDGLAINDWAPVCTVVPVTMPLPPGCPAPENLDLNDQAGVNGYIANLFECSPTMSGPVCAWIEAQAYLYRKVNGDDFLLATQVKSGINGTSIATAGKQLPTTATEQDLTYTALSPIVDEALQTATKARIDALLTALATKLLTAQGFQPGEFTTTTAGAAGLPATTAVEREDDARAKHVINMWRLFFARIEVDPVTKVVTVVLPTELSPRLIKLILSKTTDSSLEKLKELLKTVMPTSSDCIFIANTVGCSELADHGLALAIKNFNLSETSPVTKDDLLNSLSPMFHACHLDRENTAVIAHINSLTKMAREDKVTTDKTKRKTDLQLLGQRATLTDLLRALGNLQLWFHCMLPDYTSNPNKPVVDRIITTYYAALRDEMGSNFTARMIGIFPHFVTQWMTTAQGLLCQIQAFVRNVPEDFDELSINPSVFTTPLQNADSLAREYSTAMMSQQPPRSLSNDPEQLPFIYLALYPSSKRAIEPSPPSQGQNQRHRSDSNTSTPRWNNGNQTNGPNSNNNGNNNGHGGGRSNDTDNSGRAQSTGLCIAALDPANPPQNYTCTAPDEAVAYDKMICMNFLRNGCQLGPNCFRFHANVMNDLPQGFRDRFQTHIGNQGYVLKPKGNAPPSGGSGGRGGYGRGGGGGRGYGGGRGHYGGRGRGYGGRGGSPNAEGPSR
jgi:hypothetical protein